MSGLNRPATRPCCGPEPTWLGVGGETMTPAHADFTTGLSGCVVGALQVQCAQNSAWLRP